MVETKDFAAPYPVISRSIDESRINEDPMINKVFRSLAREVERENCAYFDI